MPQKSKTRKFKTKATYEAATLFGGKRCVVTGETDPDIVDWHHLDEQPSNWARENIVPLSHELNGAIEIHSKRKYGQLTREVEPAQLQLTALNRWYRTGELALAYGCNRLGAFPPWQ